MTMGSGPGRVRRMRAPCVGERRGREEPGRTRGCLLYTSDAADERSSVDLGGRRIIKKKKKRDISDGHNDLT